MVRPATCWYLYTFCTLLTAALQLATPAEGKLECPFLFVFDRHFYYPAQIVRGFTLRELVDNPL